MEISFEFSNMEDLATIQHENKDRYLKSVHLGSGKNIVVFSDTIPEPPLEELVNKNKNKISILEAENESLKEGLRAVLRGDMQSLAYILYPEDFNAFRK
jgi:hypothetical protein